MDLVADSGTENMKNMILPLMLSTLALCLLPTCLCLVIHRPRQYTELIFSLSCVDSG